MLQCPALAQGAIDGVQLNGPASAPSVAGLSSSLGASTSTGRPRMYDGAGQLSRKASSTSRSSAASPRSKLAVTARSRETPNPHTLDVGGLVGQDVSTGGDSGGSSSQGPFAGAGRQATSEGYTPGSLPYGQQSTMLSPAEVGRYLGTELHRWPTGPYISVPEGYAVTVPGQGGQGVTLVMPGEVVLRRCTVFWMEIPVEELEPAVDAVQPSVTGSSDAGTLSSAGGMHELNAGAANQGASPTAMPPSLIKYRHVSSPSVPLTQPPAVHLCQPAGAGATTRATEGGWSRGSLTLPTMGGYSTLSHPPTNTSHLIGPGTGGRPLRGELGDHSSLPPPAGQPSAETSTGGLWPPWLHVAQGQAQAASALVLPKRVLLVDDNAVNRRLTARMLSRLGVPVIEEAIDGVVCLQKVWSVPVLSAPAPALCTTTGMGQGITTRTGEGSDAIEQRMADRCVSTDTLVLTPTLSSWLTSHPCRYDLLLLDVHVPRKSGDIAVSQIRACGGVWAHVAIIAITGVHEPAEMARLSACGFDMVLPKPFDSIQLRDAIDAVLRSKVSSVEEARDGKGVAEGALDVMHGLNP